MENNPFEILQLSPDVTPEEAVKRAAQLALLAQEESSSKRYRLAIQKLTSTPASWKLAALLTHPRPEYRNAEIDRFVAAHRNRVAVDKVDVPGVDWQEVRELLLDLLARELSQDDFKLDRLRGSDKPEEIARETFEALWLGVIAQPGG